MSNDTAQLFADIPADLWWNDQGAFKTLHALNPARIRFIQDILSPNDNPRLLDAGCGGGILSMALASAGYRVTGIDSSKNAIKAASEQATLRKLGNSAKFIHTDIDEYCQNNQQQYDLVCCMELLEHVNEPGQVIGNLVRQLRIGGHLVLSTLNRSIASYIGNILLAEYILRVLPMGTHDWQYFITPAEMAEMLQNANCRVGSIAGIRLIPLLWCSTLVRQPGHHYIVHAQRLK